MTGIQRSWLFAYLCCCSTCALMMIYLLPPNLHHTQNLLRLSISYKNVSYSVSYVTSLWTVVCGQMCRNVCVSACPFNNHVIKMGSKTLKNVVIRISKTVTINLFNVLRSALNLVRFYPGMIPNKPH